MTSILQKQSRRRVSFSITLVCFLSFMAIPSTFAATTFVTNIIFDDYSDPFDTTGLIGPPGFLKAFPDPMPSSQSVSTILTSGLAVGATRFATLTHLDPVIDPLRTKGNASALVNHDLNLGPKFMAFGTDTASPARLDVDYDFTTISGGILDAGTGNTHVIVSVFDTDGGDNIVDASLAFSDALGNQSSRRLVDLGIDVAVVGDKLLDFNEFAGVDFTQLTSMGIVWENPGEAQYDGLIAAVGAGTFQSAPEPTFATALLSLVVLSLLRRSRHS